MIGAVITGTLAVLDVLSTSLILILLSRYRDLHKRCATLLDQTIEARLALKRHNPGHPVLRKPVDFGYEPRTRTGAGS